MSFMCKFSIVLFLLFGTCLNAATSIISDQLPIGAVIEDYGLGSRPEDDFSIWLKELATLPGQGQVQQIVPRGDFLYVVLKEGRIWEYDLSGTRGVDPYLDVAAARPDFNDTNDYGPSRGMRGFAFHPDFSVNGLAYTLHREDPDGSTQDYGTTYLDCEFVLAEWDFNDITGGVPAFRLLFRIRFEHNWHTAQNIGFNPESQPGDSDYGLLYACFGDNGASTNGSPVLGTTQLIEVSDVSNVGQDFSTIQAGVIRIDPLDPSSMTDGELTAMGRKRSANGNFSNPLINPFIGQSGVKEELYAKGFRNPLTLSFSPSGAPIVADVGEQTIEEINVLMPGCNYGWPVREGTFLVPWCDQVDGTELGADDSMRWLPEGNLADPAVTFYVRDKDQTNLRQETLARTGAYDDGFEYPVFQFSHEGNNLNGASAVAGGNYYTGFWCEQLEGKYLFGNISTDQIFYGAISSLVQLEDNSEVRELSLVDDVGDSTTLAAVVGSSRVNMRFGKDSYGNLYLASKTNRKLYRFQGVPDLDLAASADGLIEDNGDDYFEFTLDRPPSDGTLTYTILVAEDLSVGFSPIDDELVDLRHTTILADGRERATFRYLMPVEPEEPRFFKVVWE